MLCESILGSPRLCEFDQTYSKNRNIVKYYYNLFYFDAFKMYIYSYDGKAAFSCLLQSVSHDSSGIWYDELLLNTYFLEL